VIDDPARDIVATLSTMKFAHTSLSQTKQILIISHEQFVNSTFSNCKFINAPKKEGNPRGKHKIRDESIDEYSTVINI
jgi:hypothetical protein